MRDDVSDSRTDGAARRDRGFVLRRNLIFVLTPLVVVMIALVGVGSMASGAGQNTPPPPATTTTPPPASDPVTPARAAAAVTAADATAASGENLGVAILDRASGKETDGTGASVTFPGASVLKLFLITDLFHQQEQGTITLSQPDLTEIGSALTVSSDAAMNALWAKYHGAAAISQLIDIAHLSDARMTSSAESGSWSAVPISARDVLAVYQYLLTKLNAADRDLITGDLNRANPVGYQDVNQAFGLLDPATRTATTKAKQGWTGGQGKTVLNTTGILDGKNDIVVAVLSSRPGSATSAQYDQARQQLDAATTALIKQLGPNATR